MEIVTQNSWLSKNAIAIKLAVIAALILLLLIPASWIEGLITEREGYLQQMQNQTAVNWSGSQTIRGPVLVIPYSPAKDSAATATQNLYILPENLRINAAVKTEPFHSGIMDATVYHSQVVISGSFLRSELGRSGIKPESLHTGKAHIIFSISDLKGLKSNPVIRLQGQTATVQPDFSPDTPFFNSLQADIQLPDTENIPFSLTLDLNGSDNLNFLHTGKTTDVNLASDWQNPAFTGHYLPDKHITNSRGATAHWRMLYYNRPFPQQWTGADTLLSSRKADSVATFGVSFHRPIDQYRKTMRSTKYSSLIILLTFVSLFLTELIRRQNIHMFNYILIGAAMVIYYTLLLSFAEHTGFDCAYLIASVSTIALIAWFTSSLMHKQQVALLFGAILTLFYGFIYILIQLEEFSLLVGSIALFFIVAALMFFSRKINWEKHQELN